MFNSPVFWLIEMMGKIGNLFGDTLAAIMSLKKDNVQLAKFLTSLPPSFAQFLTLSKGENAIATWYHENGIFKYAVGAPIALANIYNFGYGIRPVGVVAGYTKEGDYVIEMEVDTDGNFFDWIHNQYVPSGRRSKTEEVHFKWNVEYHFKQISTADVKLAYS